MNPNEEIKIPIVRLSTVSIGNIPFVNIFGATSRNDYEIVDTEDPYLLLEDGTPLLWEDGSKVLLEFSGGNTHNFNRGMKARFFG